MEPTAPAQAPQPAATAAPVQPSAPRTSEPVAPAAALSPSGPVPVTAKPGQRPKRQKSQQPIMAIGIAVALFVVLSIIAVVAFATS